MSYILHRIKHQLILIGTFVEQEIEQELASVGLLGEFTHVEVDDRRLLDVL